MVAPPSSLFESSSSILNPTPPPSPEPKPAAPPPEAAPSASADSPSEADSDRPRPALLPLVVAGVEPLWEGRVFRQSEGTEADLRKYGALGYPSASVMAEIHPFANMKSKFLRGFGVTLQFARAFGFESDNARLSAFAAQNIAPVDTTFMRYAAGLRYRIHTNPEGETPFVLSISASMRRWQFSFAPELPLGPDLEVPTASYRLGRFGLDAGVEVKRVTFYAAAYYLHGFSIAAPNTRELDTVTNPYLANAPGMGGEFRGAIGVRVTRAVEVRLSLEYAIMAFHLKSYRQGDPPDGVLDSYLSAGLGPYVSF